MFLRPAPPRISFSIFIQNLSVFVRASYDHLLQKVVTDMARYRHLLNRNGYYYFRLAVPSKFAPIIQCKELTYSLKTKCYHEAKSRCAYILPIVMGMMNVARARMLMAGTIDKVTVF